METHKICSFFGHRKIVLTDELQQKLKAVIEDLILNQGVTTFLFGSRSDFDCLCHHVVTKLKVEYPTIKRIVYTCRSESCILESERQLWESIQLHSNNQHICLLRFEEEFEHKSKYTSGKASYVERNQAMINNSDYCVFYYDETYLPQPRKQSKRNITSYQPKSGTKLAYDYAKQKKKIVINIYSHNR